MCQDPLDNFLAANSEYETALADAESAKQRRDDALLKLAHGRTVRQVAEMTALSPGRVHQLLRRAREAGDH